MRTPTFWTSRTMFSTMLVPLATIYEIVSTLQRGFAKPASLPVPVICIGNLTAGGAGKTPVALYIGQWFKSKDVPAFFLSRGYGGRLEGPVLVDANMHSAREVGDEPLLLAKTLPTIVAKDRLAGARFAIASGAKAIIMDDGFQNPSIAKDLSLLVVDGTQGFGNERLLPAGPMRESVKSGLARAHAAIIINPALLQNLPTEKPVLTARTSLMKEVRGRKILAFAGLAYPQKFFDALQKAGAVLVDTVTFPDHYPYRENDIYKLLTKASGEGAVLATTSKDGVRLPPELLSKVNVIDMALKFDQQEILDGWLQTMIQT